MPETWTGPSAIDLRADGQMLQELTGKVAFVRSLPQPSVAALLEQVDVDFAGVLHRVILALALGRAELVAKKEHVSRFSAPSALTRVECALTCGGRCWTNSSGTWTMP